MDVSSYGELMKALEVGYSHNHITANGPKNLRFIKKCIEIGCIIAVDNLDELESIVAISKEMHKQQKILIRLGGFKMAKSTRFGITREHWEKSVEVLSDNKKLLEVLGYSFHIDTR